MSQLIHNLENCWKPWVQLNTPVPGELIFNEFKDVWAQSVRHRPHCSDGWYSLTLHGMKAEWTEAIEHYPGYEQYNDSNAPYTWTDIAEKCPVTKKFLLDLPYVKFGRVRFMLLAPRGKIKRHRDTEKSTLKALNIAINNPDGCDFNFYDPTTKNRIGTVPFKDNTAFYVNIGLEHEFINNTDQWRLHIILHGQTSNDFNKNTNQYINYQS